MQKRNRVYSLPEMKASQWLDIALIWFRYYWVAGYCRHEKENVRSARKRGLTTTRWALCAPGLYNCRFVDTYYEFYSQLLFDLRFELVAWLHHAGWLCSRDFAQSEKLKHRKIQIIFYKTNLVRKLWAEQVLALEEIRSWSGFEQTRPSQAFYCEQIKNSVDIRCHRNQKRKKVT